MQASLFQAVEHEDVPKHKEKFGVFQNKSFALLYFLLQNFLHNEMGYKQMYQPVDHYFDQKCPTETIIENLCYMQVTHNNVKFIQ